MIRITQYLGDSQTDRSHIRPKVNPAEFGEVFLMRFQNWDLGLYTVSDTHTKQILFNLSINYILHPVPISFFGEKLVKIRSE